MNYFTLDEDKSLGYMGYIGCTHKWGLPGIIHCPGCKASWGGGAKSYPSVELSPITALGDFEEPRAEPIEEYERLREMVRPLLPPGAMVEPGTELGPLVGKVQGPFGALVARFPWLLLARREAFDKLQAEGLRGLKGCRTELRSRQRNSPELLEFELLPLGRLHPDCLPPDRKPPCSRCGRLGLTRPDDMVLNAATLPSHLDLFRLEDFSTTIVCTERFVEACRRLSLDGVTFQLLPTA